MQRGRLVDEMVARLSEALEARLTSVVLYGAEAHGDTYRTVSHLDLMIVCADLEPPTLGLLGPSVRWWLGKRQPWPRLFTAELIRDSIDVYPIEFLDLARHRHVIHGSDPLADIRIDATLLRLQCERDLREKLMRLREGYVESRGRPRALRRLLALSYASFALVFRGYLHLLGARVPAHDREAAAALCAALGLDGAPFEEVARIAEADTAADPAVVFERYYRELEAMVRTIDRFAVQRKGEPR